MGRYQIDGGGAGFVVGVQGDKRAAPVILRKSMSDTSWLKINLSPDLGGELYSVSAPSSSVIYVCGSSGLVFKTIDGGVNWALHTVPTSQSLNSINFFNNTKGFAVGDSGTILFTSNGGLTGVDEETMPIPNNFVLYQNYPNPFNPSTVIKYSIAVAGNVTLKIFDLLGREVAKLVNKYHERGNFSVNYEASKLSAGVYIYTLSSGRFSQSKKLMLTK